MINYVPADDESIDVRLPQTGDKFMAEAPFANGAALARAPDERLYHMRHGYKLAADLLIKEAEEQAPTRRKLVYPIAFCYRHYLELTLKAILSEYGAMAGVRENWSSHNLQVLWKDVRALVANCGIGLPDNVWTEAFCARIEELTEIDRSSDAFRYPADRTGAEFKGGASLVDLAAMRETMQAIENYLEEIDGRLQHFENCYSIELSSITFY